MVGREEQGWSMRIECVDVTEVMGNVWAIGRYKSKRDEDNVNGRRGVKSDPHEMCSGWMLGKQKHEQGARKVLKQEPEVLPCHSSASSLSPQPSFSGTPYLGPSVRVWNPYHVLSQQHFPLSHPSTNSFHHHTNAVDSLEEDLLTEVYLIHNAESTMDQKPDLIGGRCPSASLTINGKRQARALAVFLNSQGLRFNVVFSSPLERAKHTALFVCQVKWVSSNGQYAAFANHRDSYCEKNSIWAIGSEKSKLLAVNWGWGTRRFWCNDHGWHLLTSALGVYVRMHTQCKPPMPLAELRHGQRTVASITSEDSLIEKNGILENLGHLWMGFLAIGNHIEQYERVAGTKLAALMISVRQLSTSGHDPCRELNIPEGKIEYSNALVEMSQGQWEGCHCSDIYTPEILNIMDRFQPDFCAPGGESQRQVEFRMVEILNDKVLRKSEKSRHRDFVQYQSEIKGYGSHNSLMQVHPIEDGDGSTVSQWEFLNRQKHPARRKSGKSRLQFVTMGDNETEDELSPRDGNSYRQLQEQDRRWSDCVGIFTHGMAIKCLLTGLLGSNPLMTSRICIDNSSITLLCHSSKSGWQIQKVNDTAHLRLL
eukprot:Gb_05421 [translate_table: standard]